MIKMDMKFSHALAIAYNFSNGKYTDEERLKAIYMIKDAPTLNSISKDKLQNALNWLFDYCFEDAEEPQTNFDHIKSMNIDEMADFLMQWFVDCMTGKSPMNVKNWLESEVLADDR